MFRGEEVKKGQQCNRTIPQYCSFVLLDNENSTEKLAKNLKKPPRKSTENRFKKPEPTKKPSRTSENVWGQNESWSRSTQQSIETFSKFRRHTTGNIVLPAKPKVGVENVRAGSFWKGSCCTLPSISTNLPKLLPATSHAQENNVNQNVNNATFGNLSHPAHGITTGIPIWRGFAKDQVQKEINLSSSSSQAKSANRNFSGSKHKPM